MHLDLCLVRCRLQVKQIGQSGRFFIKRRVTATSIFILLLVHFHFLLSSFHLLQFKLALVAHGLNVDQRR